MRWLTGSDGLKRFGYIISAWGLVSFGGNYLAVQFYEFPFDFGISLGNGAIVLAGLIAVMAGDCLREIERKISALEKDRNNK